MLNLLSYSIELTDGFVCKAWHSQKMEHDKCALVVSLICIFAALEFGSECISNGRQKKERNIILYFIYIITILSYSKIVLKYYVKILASY